MSNSPRPTHQSSSRLRRNIKLVHNTRCRQQDNKKNIIGAFLEILKAKLVRLVELDRADMVDVMMKLFHRSLHLNQISVMKLNWLAFFQKKLYQKN